VKVVYDVAWRTLRDVIFAGTAAKGAKVDKKEILSVLCGSRICGMRELIPGDLEADEGF